MHASRGDDARFRAVVASARKMARAACSQRRKRHGVDREDGKIADGCADGGDVRACGSPHGRAARAEEQRAFCADGGGDVRDAGVVAEIFRASREDGGEGGQGEIACNDRRMNREPAGDRIEGGVVGFATDEEELCCARCDAITEALPIFGRARRCLGQ